MAKSLHALFAAALVAGIPLTTIGAQNPDILKSNEGAEAQDRLNKACSATSMETHGGQQACIRETYRQTYAFASQFEHSMNAIAVTLAPLSGPWAVSAMPHGDLNTLASIDPKGVLKLFAEDQMDKENIPAAQVPIAKDYVAAKTIPLICSMQYEYALNPEPPMQFGPSTVLNMPSYCVSRPSELSKKYNMPYNEGDGIRALVRICVI